MSKHLDRSRAISITRFAQAGFAVLACGAVATAYIGLPLTQPPTATDFVVGDSTPVESPKIGPAAMTDVVGSATRLGHVANAPKPVAPPTPAPDLAAQGDARPTPGLSDVKYLGFANVGTMHMALLVVNGKQRFVREGQILDAERVKQIDPDFVLLTRDDKERRIPLQERTGERVTRLRGGPPVGVDPHKPGTGKITGIQAPKPMAGGGGVRGLSNLPDGYHSWPPAYQRRFDRVVNQLLQSGDFPDEFSLIEKAKSAMEADGFSLEDKESLEKLEKLEDESDSKPQEREKKPEK